MRYVLLILPCLSATIAVANANSVAPRYVDFGEEGQSQLLVADALGDMFIVGKVVEPSGRRQIRVIKTDPQGNVLASFDFGGSATDTPASAATDAQGNLLVAGSTDSPDFPLVNPLNSQMASQSAFLVKLVWCPTNRWTNSRLCRILRHATSDALARVV